MRQTNHAFTKEHNVIEKKYSFYSNLYFIQNWGSILPTIKLEMLYNIEVFCDQALLGKSSRASHALAVKFWWLPIVVDLLKKNDNQ